VRLAGQTKDDMARQEARCEAKERQCASLLRRRRLLALAIALCAVGIMAGESWLIKRAPAAAVASEVAQMSDISRALDGVGAGLARVADRRAR